MAYFEASGTFYLRHKEWLIDIERPSKPAQRRSALELFTGAREQVILALLVERHRFRSGLELAELSKTSTYTVSTVLAELDRREWIESEGSGRTLRRKLSRPSELFDAWAQAWHQRKELKTKWFAYVPNSNNLVEQLASRMNNSDRDEAVFTGAAAGNMVEQHLTRTDTADIIILPGESDQYAAALNLKPAEKGGNVTLIERSGASMLFTNLHGSSGVRIANTFILCLDLQDGKGRNKELSLELRHNHLKV